MTAPFPTGMTPLQTSARTPLYIRTSPAIFRLPEAPRTVSKAHHLPRLSTAPSQSYLQPLQVVTKPTPSGLHNTECLLPEAETTGSSSTRRMVGNRVSAPSMIALMSIMRPQGVQGREGTPLMTDNTSSARRPRQ